MPPGRRSMSTTPPLPSPHKKTNATPILPPPVTAACRTPSRRNRASLVPSRNRARHRQPRFGAETGRPAQGRDHSGQRGAGARRGPAEPGRAQSRLHQYRRSDRRHRRQPHPAHRTIRAGRHATDVGGAGRRRLVVANYKETQLTDVHEGQPVDIAVDMFPGQKGARPCRQHAPASGQEFALLPPDNATGNFTKVVQRIPVKIALDSSNDASVELRPGMSVIPTIETRSEAGGRDRGNRIQNGGQSFSGSIVSCPISSCQPQHPRCRARARDLSAPRPIRTAPASRPGSPCLRP